MPQDTATEALAFTHTLPITVQIFDTDCYGVMWHGSYIKWLEMGRVQYFAELGYTLPGPADRPCHVFPVVNQNLTFRSPGQLWATLNLTTQLRIDRSRLIFEQTFTCGSTQKTIMTAETTCAIVEATDEGQWKPLRKLPDTVQHALNKAANLNSNS